MHIMCRDAAMMPMRKLLLNVHPQDIALLRQSHAGNAGGILGAMNLVNMSDFMQAIENTKPSVNSNTIKRYDEWMATYGSS